jgi:hypothetical protein
MRKSDRVFSIKCNQIEKILIENQWQNLTAEKKKSIRQHLENCESCKQLQKTIADFEEAMSIKYNSPLLPDPAIQLQIIKKIKNKQKKSLISQIKDWVLAIVNYRIPVYQAGISIIIIFLFIALVKNFALSERKHLPEQAVYEISAPNIVTQINVLNLNEVVENQKPGTSAKDDTLLLKFFHAAM